MLFKCAARAAAALAVFCLLLCVAASAARAQVSLTPVGSPGFRTVDINLFSAPQGTPGSGFAEFAQTLSAVVPNHVPISARVPHAGPYDQEITQGLASAGLVSKSVFDVSEFTAPQGIFIGFVIVPGPDAPLGSSLDFANGPTIPNANLPIRVAGDVFRNGSLFEQDAFGVALDPVAGRDGSSHFVVFGAENSAFAPPGLTDLTGNYEYRLTVRDANQNGYNVSARFTVQNVIPEPGTCTLFAAGLLPLVGTVVRRRRASSPAAGV